MTKLTEAWQQYHAETAFNWSVLPGALQQQAETIRFPARSLIVTRGEMPSYIYFIQSGIVAGVREYENGNEYNYFRLDNANGCIGLLELLAQETSYVASIICMTEVIAARIDAAAVYCAIMEDINLLRRCTALLASDLYQRSGSDGALYYFRGIDRVRYYLIAYFEENSKHGGSVTVQEEYQNIASHIGMSVRTVGRNIQKLRQSGEILSKNRHILMTREQYLKMVQAIYEE